MIRAAVGGFALPLGITPAEGARPPLEGFVLRYDPETADGPDSYTFDVTVSHERVRQVLHAAFSLLPEEVFTVVEVASRDAYRAMDVFVAEEMISREAFLAGWRRFEPLLLEDGFVGAGAQCDDPPAEIFLDSWKNVSIVVPPAARPQVETLLQELGLEEVPMTWPPEEDNVAYDSWRFRPVLTLADGSPADTDDLLTRLRRDWRLILDVDPEANLDDAGRDLGVTLWHALVRVMIANGTRRSEAFVSIWITAGSLSAVELFLDQVLDTHPEWSFLSVEAVDRVAFDDRPPELTDMPPRFSEQGIHLVTVDSSTDPLASSGGGTGESRE